jgi:uncharacterized protein (DUF1697 family)
MTRYLVLQRGINVGGRNKVPMAALRELLESRRMLSLECAAA